MILLSVFGDQDDEKKSTPILTRIPKPFPPKWASAFGDDEFGLWAELCFNGATQRMRWILPGEFLMGSSYAERGRDRPQHLVRITQGFWLADTACTQAFWLAVVRGKNPSVFQNDPNFPVEGVSWNDIDQRFFPELQVGLGNDLQAQLPSEAQWEYACRAGTLSTFSFGENISLELVNFGYARVQTVPVASLPANPWGLFEMHGNVWEWCRDDLRAFSSESTSDPVGEQKTVTSRARRGGSWFNDAVSTRSACRERSGVDSRSVYIGFRWCLMSFSQE